MHLLNRIQNYPWRLKLASILLRNWRFASCGAKTLVNNPIKIDYKYINLGSGVYIWQNCRIEAVTSYAGQNYLPVIVIGSNVCIQPNLHLTCGGIIEIGNNTAIAANVTITDIDHQYTNINLPVDKQPVTISSIKIGDDCQIYNNTVILPGTNLGKHCVVGANSVVSGCFEDFTVIVGAPAKVIKKYNFETKIWEKVY